MNLQRLTLSPVQPGNDDDLIAHRQSVKPVDNTLLYLQPGIGRAFTALHGCFFKMHEGRMNQANRP
jgi:hypothetical protein